MYCPHRLSVKRWRKSSDSNPSKSVHSPASQMEHKMNIACLGNSKCSATLLRRILTEITRRKTNSHAGCGWNMHWTNTATSCEWHASLWGATRTARRGYASVKPCLFYVDTMTPEATAVLLRARLVCATGQPLHNRSVPRQGLGRLHRSTSTYGCAEGIWKALFKLTFLSPYLRLK